MSESERLRRSLGPRALSFVDRFRTVVRTSVDRIAARPGDEVAVGSDDACVIFCRACGRTFETPRSTCPTCGCRLIESGSDGHAH